MWLLRFGKSEYGDLFFIHAPLRGAAADDPDGAQRILLRGGVGVGGDPVFQRGGVPAEFVEFFGDGNALVFGTVGVPAAGQDEHETRRAGTRVFEDGHFEEGLKVARHRARPQHYLIVHDEKKLRVGYEKPRAVPRPAGIIYSAIVENQSRGCYINDRKKYF